MSRTGSTRCRRSSRIYPFPRLAYASSRSRASSRASALASTSRTASGSGSAATTASKICSTKSRRVPLAIPPRYEAVKRLGAGGAGEVWSVKDRVTGDTLAFKVLAEDAGEGEVMSLVREATALSGLEGLGVPRVVAFGALADSKRRFMVRELVEGESLEDILDTPGGVPWLEPLARASEQLTVLHRAGLLHGDIKPANVIVSREGRATLVDLGLAAPWREGGTVPQGLTPRYAAPELFEGEALTVRAEVYALGATLADGLGRRGGELDL